MDPLPFDIRKVDASFRRGHEAREQHFPPILVSLPLCRTPVLAREGSHQVRPFQQGDNEDDINDKDDNNNRSWSVGVLAIPMPARWGF